MIRDPGRDSAYFGTTSGDVLKVALNSKTGGPPALVAASVRKPKKGMPSNSGRFSGGVNSLLVLANGNILFLICCNENYI